MKDKVGVFLCKCSDNIAGKVDVEALRRELEGFDDVAFVETHELLCSGAGVAFFEQKIKENHAQRVVVAACSPKDHEVTFGRALKRTGHNEHLLQMANIREHCTWVTEDDQGANDKARALTKAAVRRVLHHEELEHKEIEANTSIVIIGGGIAGIEAALAAAADGRDVTVIEQGPSLGGMVTKIEEAAPNMECAPCMVSPRLSLLEEAENIRVVTLAEVTRVAGYLGNFEVSFSTAPRMVDTDACIGCDECIQVCPVSVTSDFDYGLAERKAIDVPFPGCFPNSAVVDLGACLHTTGKECNACVEACPMEAMDFAQEATEETILCGAVVMATGSMPFDPTGDERYGLDSLEDVYTMEQFARLTSNHGPTGGEVKKANGDVPKKIGFIHCVGRDELGYCSGFCCQAAIGLSLAASQGDDMSAVHLVQDLVCPGEMGANLLGKMGPNRQVIRVDDLNKVSVSKGQSGLLLSYGAAGQPVEAQVDMVVLVNGARANNALEGVLTELGVTRSGRGFVAQDHHQLRPTSANLEGLYVVGGAAGPADIASSVTRATSGVGLALSRLVPGKKLTIKTIVAATDESLCSACQLCLSVCPYAATRIDSEKKVAVVNEVLCQGCGTCVATCPSGAATARHFTDRQIGAEVEEVLNG